jgi:phage baseplate assembly protein W
MNETPSTPSPTSFLGVGWSFPPEFSSGTGEVVMTSEEPDIEASLRILLGTTLGERYFDPNYGLDLHELLFEPMSTTMTTALKDRAKVAILTYESRINLLGLDLETGPDKQLNGMILITVEYEIKSTNSRFNLVYPFYLADASEVRAQLGGTTA